MKKLFLASMLMVSAGIAQADTPQLVNADGSELSAICIAAITSREAMYDKAAELGVRNFEPSEMRCNGQTVSRFISIHRAMAKVAAERGSFVFSKSDDTPVTELCMAAIRSEQEYRAVKERLFADEEGIEAEVRCNGMSLTNFARKYRTPVSAVSLR
ncbi:MAG: hypothetical protein SV422_09700 [Pseudomonadota bacterium]|nr:hypothetical protein [Pseudomonadota bacterium]